LRLLKLFAKHQLIVNLKYKDMAKQGCCGFGNSYSFVATPTPPPPPTPITAGDTELIVLNEVGAGSVTAGAFRVEVSNVGFGNGVVNGAVLPSGKNSYFEYSHFDHLENKQYYLPEITYDATGTEFFISIYKPL
jgi:hypothetical protein